LHGDKARNLHNNLCYFEANSCLLCVKLIQLPCWCALNKLVKTRMSD
jgi:hypothetical protein